MCGRFTTLFVGGLALWAVGCAEPEFPSQAPPQIGQYTVSADAAAAPEVAPPVATVPDLSLSEMTRQTIVVVLVAAVVALLATAAVSMLLRERGGAPVWMAAAAIAPAVAVFIGTRQYMHLFAGGGGGPPAYLAVALRGFLYPLFVAHVASSVILLAGVAWLAVWRRGAQADVSRSGVRVLGAAAAAIAVLGAGIVTWSFARAIVLMLPSSGPPRGSIADTVEAISRQWITGMALPPVIMICFVIALVCSLAVVRERTTGAVWIVMAALLAGAAAAAAWLWSLLQMLATIATT